MVTALIAVSVLRGAQARRREPAVVYGAYLPPAQLIVLGATGAVNQAGREDWPGFGVPIAIMLIATGSALGRAECG